jgi:hypothetical protein
MLKTKPKILGGLITMLNQFYDTHVIIGGLERMDWLKRIQMTNSYVQVVLGNVNAYNCGFHYI